MPTTNSSYLLRSLSLSRTVMASLMVGAYPPMACKPVNLSPPHLSFSLSPSVSGVSLSAPAVSLSLSAPSPALPLVYCGRGDKKTAKGKRFNHSFGNARPRNKNKGRGPPRAPTTPLPPKKDRFDDDEKVKIEIDEF